MARFMGTETEYGISTPSDPLLSPIITSTHVVVSYAAHRSAQRARWDFESEYPLRDQRGFDLKRYHTVPVVDPNTVGVANVVTTNGARFYVDHAHPEYSAPETTNAFDAMVYDAAGDMVLNEAVAATEVLSQQGISALDGHEPCPPLKIYKHNVDGKGASYGSHENYLYSRDTDFDVLAQALIPYFVTRQIIIGAGRVGLGERGEVPGFQISQRADYIETEISLETTLNRGIINTRDEPHADGDRFGRLHVIIGDANMSQTANYLKLGMTSLIIAAIEAGETFEDLALANPVDDVKRISRDLTCSKPVELKDGRKLRALDILRIYRSRVQPATEDEQRVCAWWDRALSDLETDPMLTAGYLDWTAKLAILNGYRARGLTWDDPKLALIDLQYCDIDPAKSVYHALLRTGRMHQLVSEEQIRAAVSQAPANTRASLRGHMLSHYPDDVLAASWDAIVLADSEDTAARILLPEVDCLTQEDVDKLCPESATLQECVAALEESGLVNVQRLRR